MTRRKWTPDEITYLTRHYGIHPTRTLAQTLNRTPHSIAVKAQRLALGDRIPHGYTPLAWAHPRNCGDHWGASVSIIRAAKRDGVLRQAQHHRGRPYIAPTTWIDDWLNQRHAAPTDERVETIIRTWVRTRTLATWLGIPHERAAMRLLHTRGRLRNLARFARRYRIRTLPGQPLYWHPTDAREIVAKYHVQQAARRMRAAA